MRHSFHLEPEMGRASGLVHIMAEARPEPCPPLHSRPALQTWGFSRKTTDNTCPIISFLDLVYRRRVPSICLPQVPGRYRSDQCETYFCSTSFLFTHEAGGMKLPPPSSIYLPRALCLPGLSSVFLLCGEGYTYRNYFSVKRIKTD